MLDAGFLNVDEIRFDLPYYQYVGGPFYTENYLCLDNIHFGQSVPGEDGVARIDVLANDTDASAIHVSATALTSTLGASLSINPDGTIAYDPRGSTELQSLGQGETAEDSFVYTVADIYGATATATVTVTVGGGNDTFVFSDGDGQDTVTDFRWAMCTTSRPWRG